MPKHDGWAAALARGVILAATFARTKAAAAELAGRDRLPEGTYRLIRVRLTPADPMRRQR